MIKRWDAAENWFVKSTVIDFGQLPNDGTMKRTVKFDDNSSNTNCTVNVDSSGFRPKTTDGKANAENGKYIYMAFAEMPMVGTNGTIALAI